eukprot:Selendium_serpulae@DN290_c0_g1_i1.p1
MRVGGGFGFVTTVITPPLGRYRFNNYFIFVASCISCGQFSEKDQPLIFGLSALRVFSNLPIVVPVAPSNNLKQNTGLSRQSDTAEFHDALQKFIRLVERTARNGAHKLSSGDTERWTDRKLSTL